MLKTFKYIKGIIKLVVQSNLSKTSFLHIEYQKTFYTSDFIIN